MNGWIVLLAAGAALGQQPRYISDDPGAKEAIERGLRRLAEEAGAFERLAPKVFGVEKLEQQSLVAPRRLRLSGEAPGPAIERHELISEYGFSSFRNAPGAVREFRQVVSVDGKPVRSREKARETLTAGMRSESDKARKKMLKDLERYGLNEGATDFGQLVLLFTGRQIRNYEFKFAGRQFVGPDSAILLEYRQGEGPDLFTVFEKREAIHQKTQGEVWLRERDGLPLRISLSITRRDGNLERQYLGVVDYLQSAFGLILPASITYREQVNGQAISETRFSYSDFRMFSADASVRFESEVPQ